MASFLVILIIIGCAAYQYLKGSVTKAFATLVISIIASVVSFGFFEPLAGLFTGQDGNSKLAAIFPWAQFLSFVFLFVITFAILQTLLNYLSREKINFSYFPEHIGRIVVGIVLGIFLSGNLLTALILAPLPDKYPYQRFNARRPNPDKPNKVFLNADGFAVGWFSLLSRGSFSSNKSFAALHPGFLDQVFLNRCVSYKKITTIIPGSKKAIEVPKEKAVWPTSKRVTDTEGKAVALKSGYTLTTIRVGMRRILASKEGKFSLSQLRLICKRKDETDLRLSGKATNVYPTGYFETAEQIKLTQLNDTVGLDSGDFKESVKWIDFVFYVPDEYVPVLIEFKQTTILELPSPINTQEVPEPAFFKKSSEK